MSASFLGSGIPFMGNHPAWMQIVFLIWLASGFVLLAGWSLVKPPIEEKNMPTTINITSNNQSGGITAHTVNIGHMRLTYQDEIAASLAAALPKEKPVRLTSIGSQNDMAIAQQYLSSLQSNGFKVSHETHIGVMSPPPDGQIAFELHPSHTKLTIAPRG